MSPRSVLLSAWVLWLAFVVGLYWLIPFPHQELVLASARQEHLNPMVVAAVIRTESGFRADIVSRRGAVGLMQVLPDTASWISGQTAIRGPLSNPATNIRLGTWYLAYLLKRYHGHWILALAAYNSGPRVVDGWLASGVLTDRSPPSAIPYAQTRAFVTRVWWLSRAYSIVYVGVRS